MYCVNKGKGDAILFIHGMPTYRTLWDSVIQEISGSFKCLAVDVSGPGNSPSIPYAPDFSTESRKNLNPCAANIGSSDGISYLHHFQYEPLPQFRKRA